MLCDVSHHLSHELVFNRGLHCPVCRAQLSDDHKVHIPRYRPVGWALIAGPVILVATMSGTALVATTGIAAGVLLLGTAVAGFHDLMGVRRAAEQARANKVVVPATAGLQL